MACTNKKIGHNNPRRVLMRKILLSLTAASAIVAAASIAPASAMTVGTASGIQAAIDGTSAVEEVAYVCRHRYYSSRRACFWTPGGHYRPYRRYRRW
jgi:hypothetical protein